DSAQLAEEASRLFGRFKTLLMATASAEGIPEASYAPFVRLDDNCFYVYVSALSRHTANLNANPALSVLFIEDERDANQLFARARLTFDCRAELVTRESTAWTEIMDVLEEKFGNVIELIRPLQDFKLFRIRPENGIYVKGFAQAYRITGPELANFEHIKTSDTRSK
ncbi:MAG: HugZ family protein, partial [Acidiferrobacterales bacterium]